MAYDFDLFVIGAGSGGVRATRMAGQAGARVAIAEESRFGGTCVIRGCIPKKLFVYASHYAEEFEDAAGFGWSVGKTSFDWPTLIANKDKEIDRLEGLYRKTLGNAGATIFHDRAVLKDAHTVHLVTENRDVTAQHILIATGGKPSRMGVPGDECCITSDDAFYLDKLPKSIVIAGGGYIALEFAHIFHGLGVEVIVVCRQPKILRGFDEDLRDALRDSMTKHGIRVVPNTVFSHCRHADNQVQAVTANGETFGADQILLALGRDPNTKDLGLERAGVVVNKRGAIIVDRYSQTSVPSIYAIGDVTGRKELTPVAIHEAMCFVKTVFGGTPSAPDYEMIATAVFTQPEVGTVGLAEGEALEYGHAVDVYKTSFRPLKHTLTGRDERVMMKLIVDSANDRVLGCHILGPEAGEMVQLVAIAMKMGATKVQFDATVAVHPTMAEELVTMRTKTYSKSPNQKPA